MRELRFPRVWLAGGWLLVAFVVAGSLVPASGAPVAVDDKLLHLCTYLLLGIWFGAVYRPARHLALALALIAFGFSLEALQGLGGVRSFDIVDGLANAAGVIAGIAISRTPLGSWCQWVEGRVLG